jgi:hypothetical protein
MTRSSEIRGCITFALVLVFGHAGWAQQEAPETPQQQIARMAQAVARAQAQVDASQQQLIEVKREMTSLEQRLGMAEPGSAASGPQTNDAGTGQDTLAASVEALREQQGVQESQIATLDQVKVESESKYPVKVSGLILMNGFVNTSKVDQAASPTIAVGGPGSTGASLRQTVLGIDARGPHLAGASSHADVRVDFFGDGTSGGYTDAGGLLRMRTAHAALDWENTSAFFELDRPIINPNAPTSLTAIANPPLAWSGNLWNWSPQVGVTHGMDVGRTTRITMQAALIDALDPPLTQLASIYNVSLAEQSRWPGSEVHFEVGGRQKEVGPSIGAGGYFSPHETPGGDRFNAWAGTLDYRLPLPLRLEWSGSVYRGEALGGLGGGAYKDYVYSAAKGVQPLDDVGGWTQLKERAGERLEFNGAFGIDNAFASELRGFAVANGTAYQNLARNRTFFANAIYSPSAYLLFSIEYRHIASGYLAGSSESSNVVGVAAGYKF